MIPASICGIMKDSFNFDDWQFFQTEELRRELVSALARLVRCHAARGDLEPAIGHARQWLALDRLDEAAHCELMRLYAWSGQRSAALRQYEECVRILKSALGVSPQEETAALHQAIQEGRAPPPPVDQSRLVVATSVASSRRAHEAPPLPQAPSPAPDEEKRIVTVVCVDMSGSFLGLGDLSAEDEAALIRRLLGVVEGGLTRYCLLPQPTKARGIEGLRAKLVGRDEEFAKLKEALAQVLEGRGQMVTLIGEAGVGKSRLVAELKQIALTPAGGQAAPLWLEGRCLELGTAASYAPFIDILRVFFAWGAQDDDRARREHIRSSLQGMMGRGALADERFEDIYPLTIASRKCRERYTELYLRELTHQQSQQ